MSLFAYQGRHGFSQLFHALQQVLQYVPGFGGLDAFVFVDGSNVERYSPKAGPDGARLPVAALSAEEVRQLLADEIVREHHIFAMDGHEDGIVAFAETGEIAASVLITDLQKALEMAQ